MSRTDDLIAEYAAHLQEIYDKRTASDHTFTGVLGNFLHEVNPEPARNYKIVRFYQRDRTPTKVIKTGLTLEEAQDHCNDPETSSSTATTKEAKAHTKRYGPWFDGYTDESR